VKLKEMGGGTPRTRRGRLRQFLRTWKKRLRKKGVAWKNFSGFSNSTKLQYVYWVNNAKKDETRRKRIASVVLKAGSVEH